MNKQCTNWFCNLCGWFPDDTNWSGPLPTTWVEHQCRATNKKLITKEYAERINSHIPKGVSISSGSNLLLWAIAEVLAEDQIKRIKT